MKRILIAISVLFFAASCSDAELAKTQIDPKNPTSVPGATIFTNAQRNLWDQMTSTNVNRNVFRFFSQNWAATTYPDESAFDVTTRKIPDTHWLLLYRNVLANFKEANRVITATTTLDAAVKKNQLAINEILSVYTWEVLVSTFGNIPYSQALDFNNVNPKYDDAKTIYADLAKRLDAATGNLSTSAGSFGTADVVYGGDVAKWVKFANSLKLKMGMILADVDATTSKTMVEAAAKNVFSSAADNAALHYFDAYPNTNPIWVDLVQSGRQDYVPSNTIVDITNKLNDPRRVQLFTMKDGKYVGGIYGQGNSYSNFSHIGDKLMNPSLEAMILDYSEVEFLLAEAVERGYSVGGTATTHYNNAVTASIVYWGGTAADATTYLTQPSVAYATAATTYKEKIGTQKWLALYNRGFESWTEWRRLDFPKLNVPTGKTYADIPVRFSYPSTEQTLNGANYTAAAAAIGTDKLTTKLFWDKF